METENTQFPLWVFSNASTDVFPNNTLSHFKNRLSKPIILKGNWEVAVNSITYPNCFQNIKEICSFKIYLGAIKKKIIGTFPIDVSVDVGFFSTVEDLIAEIELQIRTALTRWWLNYGFQFRIAESESYSKDNEGKARSEFRKMWLPVFEYDPKRRKYFLNSSDFQQFDLVDFSGESIWNALGYERNIKLINSETEPIHRFSMTQNFPSMFIYSPIVEYNSVGDVSGPLLVQVPNRGKYNHYRYEEFEKQIYIKVNQNILSEIEILITDVYGKPIAFPDGVVSVQLQFKSQS